MRTAAVATNETCNQNCTYCNVRRPVEDQSFVRPAAVRARIDAAVSSGAREIVLTGGEPTLRRDLAALIAHGRRAGAAVILETNGTLVDADRAAAWRDAGLARVRVNLSGGDARLDSVTRDEGGFARTLAGLSALHQAGLPVEICAAVVRSTLPLLPSLPATLAEVFGPNGGCEGIVLSVPVEGPDAGELVSYGAAAETIQAVDAAARVSGILVRLDSHTSPPPCVFPTRASSSHLYALSPGAATRPGFTKVEACASCQIADRCPGFSQKYLERFPLPAIRPITDDRTRRRLSVVSSVRDQISRELLSPNRREKPGQPPEEERIVRVNFQCNQACRFCFVSTHLPPATDAAIREAIVDAGRAGARITISGGEPTLNPRLKEYLQLAKSHSKGPVELQSNAIRFADATLAREIIEAGVDEIFISLHGSTADISDAVTEAPGTFVKTVAGIDNLARLEVALGLNFVMCERNYRDLPAYVRFVHDRWPKAMLSISFVAPSSDLVPNEPALVPRYSDVLPYLREALAIAAERKLWVSPFDFMCGLPLCLWPAPDEEVLAKADIPEGFDQGEFLKTDTCNACAARNKCFGLRRRYAELHGTGELRAL